MAYVVGLMSGTSLDGCDAALVQIDGDGIRQIAYLALPMPPELKARILDCCSLDKSNIALTCSLNVELGHYFARAALSVCEKAGISPRQLECIGSHGQTVYHIPVDEGGLYASTLQLGEPAVIAYETCAPVVSSFRAMDMAAGGRGAPLVPYPEFLIYRAHHARALQNIGGIGNVTALPADCTLEDVFAFDTGPGNMIIDALAQRFFGIPYDDDGRIAAKGAVNDALLSEWMDIPFIRAQPPKATGRELYGAQFVEAQLAAHPGISPEDWLATATAYTALSIAENYELYVFPRCPAREVILSGGGARNSTLRRMLARRLPGRSVLTQEEIGWDSDAKEAVAFAVMAHETMNGRPGNAPGATGASRRVILGSVTPAPV